MNQLPKPDDYRAIRLSSDRRLKLMAHARAQLYNPPEEKAELEAHAALLGEVRALVRTSLPASDMEVLKRYGHTTTVGHVQFRDAPRVFDDGDKVVVEDHPRTAPVVCFCPRDVRVRDAAEYKPSTGCHRGPRDHGVPADQLLDVPPKWTSHVNDYDARGNYQSFVALDIGDLPNHEEVRALLMPALIRWLTAVAETNRARSAVLSPLHSVVHKASTLQAVAEVWPEAMRLADQFEGVRLADEAGVARITNAVFGAPK